MALALDLVRYRNQIWQDKIVEETIAGPVESGLGVSETASMGHAAAFSGPATLSSPNIMVVMLHDELLAATSLEDAYRWLGHTKGKFGARPFQATVEQLWAGRSNLEFEWFLTRLNRENRLPVLDAAEHVIALRGQQAVESCLRHVRARETESDLKAVILRALSRIEAGPSSQQAELLSTLRAEIGSPHSDVREAAAAALSTHFVHEARPIIEAALGREASAEVRETFEALLADLPA